MISTIALFFLSVYTILALLAYIPQIVKMLKTKHADDINKWHWILWIFADLSYLGYVLIEAPQFGLIFVCSLDLCLIIFSLYLTEYYQYHNKRKDCCLDNKRVSK